MDRTVKMSRLLVLAVLVLLGPVVGLTALAYATPMDPSWIHGIYDGADDDNVILLLTSEAGGVTPSLLPDVFRLRVADRIPQHGSTRVATATASTLQSRAPPA
jgi:hypothetical protein